MFTVTLLVDPVKRGLDLALVGSVANAWGAGEVDWLAVDEAASFPIASLPDNADQVWRDLQNMGVDCVMQAGGAQRAMLLLADMDSTMIQQECIDELAAAAGVGAQVSDITARAMNGELDFEQAIDERVGLLAGLDENIIVQVMEERISYMPGGRALVQTMKANGAYAALVSGGFTSFTARVAGHLGFDENRANTLDIQNGKLTGKVIRPILGQDAKLQALRELVERDGIGMDQTIAVGDGMNDLLMLQEAGLGVALHGKPALQERCKAKINHGDLSALLYLQGYTKDEFVS